MKIIKKTLKLINGVSFRIYLFLRNLNPFLFYYKKGYIKKILNSRPFECKKESDIEIHTITSKDDLLNSLGSLKTFFNYSGLRPKIIFHGDGSLGRKESRLLMNHFKGCRVIIKKQRIEK